MDVYARYKASWSRPVNEQDVKIHLSYLEGEIFCGIDKQHPDVYDYGIDPIVAIESSWVHICKRCRRIYESNTPADAEQ